MMNVQKPKEEIHRNRSENAQIKVLSQGNNINIVNPTEKN